MIRKIILAVVVLGLVMGFSSLALAEEKIEFEELRLTAVREEPVNVLSYTGSGLDFLSEVVARLIKTGKPSVVFCDGTSAALEVTFVEKFLGDNVDLVGGATLRNEEPSEFIVGLQYTGLGAREGGIWDWFNKLCPSVYLVKGNWYLGVAYEFRVEE